MAIILAFEPVHRAVAFERSGEVDGIAEPNSGIASRRRCAHFRGYGGRIVDGSASSQG